MLLVLPILFTATWFLATATHAAELAPFTSDGCSLFPDGTATDRNKWCDCCLAHDRAYWQGGTEAEREQADAALRDCVTARTGDPQLAETMYLGVRAGGHPAFPVWYRWGYGWDYGRGYQALTKTEQQQVQRRLVEYAQQNPVGFCAKEPPPAPRSGTAPTAAVRAAETSRKR